MPDSHETSTRADVEARLHGASEAIQHRLDAIQDEVATTGAALREYLRRHPLTGVGGSLLAGLLIGWLLSGRRRLNRTHRRLLRHYVDALRDEVRDAVAGGTEVGEAVQDALRHRAPLIVYSEDEASPGFLRQAFDLGMSAAFPLVVRSMLTGFLEQPDVNGQVEADAPPEDLPVGDEYSAS